MADNETDRALTAVTDDGAFRVITICSTRTVAAAIAAQNIVGQSAVHLADLITGASLVRLSMAPDLRVQGLVRGQNQKGTIVADVYPDGACRGLVRETSGAIEVGPGSLVQVMRSLPNGSLQQGIVEIPNDYGISGALMVYMLESEQVTTVIGVGCAMEGDSSVVAAGGWLVQLLPECEEPPLALMYERMRHDFVDPRQVLRDCSGDPQTLMDEILYGMPFHRTGESSIAYRCQCSETRVLASMATLGHEDIQDILTKGEPLFITCDYCHREYEIQPEALRGLLSAS